MTPAGSEFKTLLSHYIPSIHQAIQTAGMGLQTTIDQISPRMTSLVYELIHHCDGGKKIRGALSLMAYEYIQKQQHLHHLSIDITPLAAAIEIFQTAILIHDDIIDQSDLRRGRQTIHTQLGGHYGISQAICVGDIGFFLANQLINDLALPSDRIIQLIRLFSQMVIATGTGEMLDVDVSHAGRCDYDEIISVMRYKTARYTIGYPLMLGAIAAGADHNILQLLQQYGDAVGIAFQIADDMLGLYGDTASLGKPVVSDIIENKQTLLLRYARNHADTTQLSRLDILYGKADITSAEVAELKTLFEQIGALDYARQQRALYLTQAMDVLEQLPRQGNHSFLIGLIDMVQHM